MIHWLWLWPAVAVGAALGMAISMLFCGGAIREVSKIGEDCSSDWKSSNGVVFVRTDFDKKREI